MFRTESQPARSSLRSPVFMGLTPTASPSFALTGSGSTSPTPKVVTPIVRR
ncbi:MAG: hypothetical protein IBJ18_11395 [Phycisphaerales bacterium]|nr:hypothetical protein [Phycisphaerales bacterium]